MLSKTTIPLVVLPLVRFAIVVATQLVMMLLTSVLLISHGMSPASTWTYVPLFQNWFILLYGLAAIALWHAPIYGWALLISGWARRATFLWAVLPFIVIAYFREDHVRHLPFRLDDERPFDGIRAARFRLSGRCISRRLLAQLTPAAYLSSPGLWLGLLVAVVFIAVAVRLRRYRGPL